MKEDHYIRSKQTVKVHSKLADEGQNLSGFFQPFASKERLQIAVNSCTNKKAALNSVTSAKEWKESKGKVAHWQKKGDFVFRDYSDYIISGNTITF